MKNTYTIIANTIIIMGFLIMMYSISMIGYYTYKNRVGSDFDEKMNALLESGKYCGLVYLGAVIVVFGCFLLYLNDKSIRKLTNEKEL